MHVQTVSHAGMPAQNSNTKKYPCWQIDNDEIWTESHGQKSHIVKYFKKHFYWEQISKYCIYQINMLYTENLTIIRWSNYLIVKRIELPGTMWKNYWLLMHYLIHYMLNY